MISSFSQLVQEKPEASKAIEEYHPQLLEQIRENVQVSAWFFDVAKVSSCRYLNQIAIIGSLDFMLQNDFDDMCKKRRINLKLRELENLLPKSGEMASESFLSSDPKAKTFDRYLPQFLSGFQDRDGSKNIYPFHLILLQLAWLQAAWVS